MVRGEAEVPKLELGTQEAVRGEAEVPKRELGNQEVQLTSGALAAATCYSAKSSRTAFSISSASNGSGGIRPVEKTFRKTPCRS